MKPAKSKKKLLLIIALSVFATAITLFLLSRIDYVLAENPVYEVNTEATIASLFSEIKAGVLDDPDGKLDTAAIGVKTKEATLFS